MNRPLVSDKVSRVLPVLFINVSQAPRIESGRLEILKKYF